MQPGKTSATLLFNAPTQYVIPVFQRGYVWTLEKQVAPLWADVEDRALCMLERRRLQQTPGGAHLAPLQKHFLGSVVLTPVINSFGRVSAYEVIDGQQRTTTLHLLLLAFKHAAVARAELQGVARMLEGLVRNPGPYSVESDHHKVWPTKAGRAEMGFLDNVTSAEAVCQEFPAVEGRRRYERPLMVEAYLYLHQAILCFLRGKAADDPENEETDRTVSDRLIHSVRRDNRPWTPCEDQPILSERAECLFMALQDAVQIMTLTLEGEDDPQVIFETLNARGEPLLASDLIRNFVFLDAARNQLAVDKLYAQYWQNFDEQQDSKNKTTANRYWREKERQGRITYPRIDLFFYHLTVLRRGEETKVSHVFQGFKEWWQREKRNLEAELARIVETARLFRELLSPEGTDHLAEFARLIKLLDVSTLTPVYLFLREHYADDDEDLKQALRDLSSYIVRRAVCGYTTKNYNRVFLRLLEILKEAQDPAAVLREYLNELGGHSQCWPTDDQFREAWMYRPVYQELRPGKTAAILRALEVASRNAKHDPMQVPTVEYLTVEHVLPQSWELSGYDDLEFEDVEARARRNRHLHTFGNLTLLTQSLNSSVSNGPFLDTKDPTGALVEGKRTMICRYSLLWMNSYFQSIKCEGWDEDEITRRGAILFEQARRVWAHA